MQKDTSISEKILQLFISMKQTEIWKQNKIITTITTTRLLLNEYSQHKTKPILDWFLNNSVLTRLDLFVRTVLEALNVTADLT